MATGRDLRRADGAAGALPTPLYVLYQRREGFGTGMLTVAFAIYVLGVVVTLLGMGRVSAVLRPLAR
ncbi:hypothetical protein [Actinokineospora iranica]|uniref:Uncharacterized protein n=1 Tax=Actinokineospora iranica TaxID=1271860 RepID=A0A1G6U3Y6_9PSEU|nr:hypothetical protein [Actinokineospora iranica]SDD35396.1 hypothetical protein SAMN05216174_11066 [Actinokineospora iranica]